MAGAGPDGPPEARGTGDAGHYPAFVARLREAGLDPDVEQLRDALWLARWARRPATSPQETQETRDTREPQGDGPRAGAPAAAAPAPR
ncbi:hypothetical protein ACFVWY_32130, partial [Streptomyces sp. NPDC058195]|uniref:hypothetical protein n=1 Tax=Streptomyces sp. NPDC058195 TaxID=3346375 RepID=UPI0036E66DAF